MTDYVKLPEVARRLDVSEKTARRIVRAGKLPAVFIGGAYRVSEEDLEKYLENARVVPGKVPAPPAPQQSFIGLLEEERRAAEEWSVRVLSEHLARRVARSGEALEEELKASDKGTPVGDVYKFVEEFFEEERAVRVLYEGLEGPQPETQKALATIDEVYSRIEKLVAPEFDEKDPAKHRSRALFRERAALNRQESGGLAGGRDERRQRRSLG